MKYSELERKLRNAGCTESRSGENHPIGYSSITEHDFPAAHLNGEEVKPLGKM